MPDFQMDWLLECEFSRMRPIHHYSRYERFDAILFHLCGGGWVPEDVVEQVMEDVDDWDESRIWGKIQKSLGRMGMSRYYNRIPYILEQMGMRAVMTKKPCGLVLEKFIEMSAKFDRIKHGLERKYFPCLRYCAIRLLYMYGADIYYHIPIVKTPCKVAVLDEIFNILCDP